MKKLLLGIALLASLLVQVNPGNLPSVSVGTVAHAATCSDTTPAIKDANGTIFNAPYSDDGTGSGACQPNVFSVIKQGGSALSASNPLPTEVTQGGSTLSSTNPLPVTAYGTTSGTSLTGVSGSPVLCDPVSSTWPTYTAGDAGWCTTDLEGRSIVAPYAPSQQQVRGTVNFGSGSAVQLLAAGASGLNTYLTDWSCYNNGSSATLVTLNDANSTILVIPSGGGNNKNWEIPLVSSSTATAISATPNAANASAGCTATGFIAP